MKNRIPTLFLLLCISITAFAQGHKGDVSSCAPMKAGKVCYQDTVHVNDMNQLQLFDIINKWAQTNYGKDVFLSNVNANKAKGTIGISSKVELILNETDKTIIKYRMNITCHDNSYAAEVSNITYQYDPKNEKKYKNYSAESIIANNGASNTVSIIKDPKLFCNATFFFVENLFSDIMDAVNDAE